ncbi:MAG: phosphatase PAP2 family protein [bacterium]|nr:phosphatase PAP2 family protein [bacterium]
MDRTTETAIKGDHRSRPFNLTDIVSFIYIIWVICLVSIFRQKVHLWYLYVLSYSLYFVFILLITRLYQKYPASRVIAFLRHLYPVITFFFVYKSISGFVTVLYGGFIDPLVLKFQVSLFGGHPEVFLEKLVSPVMTEIMKFSYFSYYFYMPVSVLILFFSKRIKDLEYFVFMVTFMFYICYAGFVLFPIEGPRFTLEALFRIKVLKGFIFTPLQDFLMVKGQTIGACMPSSHLAVAWTCLFLIRKFFGKLPFYIILPVICVMSVAIVYNRYHYVADAVTGILFALIFYPVGRKFYLAYENK